MAFSPEQQTLAVTVINLTGLPHRLQDVHVLGSLPPLHPCPVHASVQYSPSLEAQSLVLLLKVGSVKELQRCVLRLAVHARDQQSPGGTALGELEAECGGTDWGPDNLFHFSAELNTSKGEMQKDVLLYKGLSRPPQIFVSLHYQPLAHCVKAAVLRADNLQSLANTSAGADYQVVINLHHEGNLISSKETKADSSTKWNSSFMFDLPAGDISQLSLMLEFVIMQKPLLTDGEVVGRVLIGADAAEAGRAHWRDVCSLQVEQARWHIVQPELL
ncbi:synaptotagmin-4-like [Salarias fasciatus]|uniref:synaptotagmin-4-like n=1 Tax=Salarias fasciatus TaxID=181472 RepID=UPI00117655A7|nr:synaptotagmin-4-like [Salarias fasciatus]